MILPADVALEFVAGSRSIDFEPVGSPHVSADAEELPHAIRVEYHVSNLFDNNRADRCASPEAVASDDTIGHD